MTAMQVILGSTSCREHLRVMQLHGWGRMWCGPNHPIRPFPGERWGLDNMAFTCWRHGVPWDESVYLRSLDKAVKAASKPYLAVIPDRVAAGRESLDLSASWIERMPAGWPLYLAVQDGMTLADVEPFAADARIAGLFLGGSDEFKATAHDWSDLAHQHGKKFHYARAGTMRKLWLARMSNSDSIDSCFPIWKRERMEQFVRWWGDTHTQLLIPWS